MQEKFLKKKIEIEIRFLHFSEIKRHDTKRFKWK
jgi:hypothetical protein